MAGAGAGTRGFGEGSRGGLEWGSWSDLARIVLSRAEAKLGNAGAAAAALDPVRMRIEGAVPPEYVYRAKLSAWESVHELPAWERALVLAGDGAKPPANPPSDR